ncbi:MAG: tripartite tricarboxylate transporter substrate binding protein [Rhodospirillaceae bacterium]|jgi:tripartite-type tricarboxylate transporter receptor subunit TctC|nr:tripartite tricarboxylate transporter substrate binding protein [Rhodospirillaceae bacterium]MBT5664052.1 tripartite tricarboxylate transporter substrate binding protein [Rhodospirillaceae bacterium]MBT5810399.1 tripartite tricarboxylate transporter substrate binding protein [Rhodospirillaceae bacterium]
MGLAIIAATALPASAAEYPVKPVTYVIPFGDGGESSIAARLQQPVFKQLTGQDLVVVNKPGGGGAVVWSQMTRMPTDGYTIVGVNLPHIILQPTQGAGYRMSNIAVVHIFHYTPDAIVVAADSPYKSLQDLIDDAVQRPGKVQISGSGRASANHLAQVRLDRVTGGETIYRPYKGTAASIAALLQGRVDAAMAYTTAAKKYGSDIRVLAVAMEKRHPEFPDTPTFRELDIDMVDGAYRGVAVPNGTPIPIRKAISALFSRIGRDAAFIEKKHDLGFAPLDIGYDALPVFLSAQREKSLATARQAGLID